MREGRWSAIGDVAAVCLLVVGLAILVSAALVSRGDDEAAGVVAAGTVAALGVVVAARHARERRRAHDRRVTEDALAALEAVMDPTLSSLPVAGLLEEVLVRTREALRADFTCVLVRGVDHRRLEVRAAAGPPELAAPGMERSPGPGVLQSVARHSGPFVVGAPLGRDLAPSDAAARAVSSLAACPLLVDGRLLGVLVAGAPEPAHFEGAGLRLLGVAGERIATALERSRLDEAERRSRLASDHAHLHLRVLARAGAVLGTALDSYEPALRSLGDGVVPDFADWFGVDVLEEGAVRRMTASWSARGVTVTRSPTAARPVPSPHPSLDRLVKLAFAEMRPQLLAATDRLGGELVDARFHRAADVKEATTATTGGDVDSIVVVPVRLGDTFNGALTFVRTAGRRGYRPSDVEVARELVDRVAVAVERVAAWRESHRAAAAARHHAERLGELVEASLVMNAQLGEAEVLGLLTERAHRVLDAAVVAVAAADADGVAVDARWPPVPPAGPARSPASRHAVRREAAVARASEAVLRSGRTNRHSPTDGPGWIAVPIADAQGVTSRAVVAVARDDDALDDDDESVLTLLTQMASVALQNAQLYARVSSNEARLQAVVQASPLAIAELQPTGALRWGNRAADELFGSGGPLRSPARGDEEVAVPSRGGSLTLADSGRALAGLLDQARSGASIVGVELDAVRADGERRELSVSASPLVDEGEVTGVLLIAQDVTAARHMLEQVHQSERLAATSRMAGALAHDFNNLLTVILGCSEVLSRDVQDEGALHDIAAIRRAGARAAELTGQLLRIGQGRPAQAEIVDVHDVLSSMRPMLASVLGPEVELEIGASGPPAYAVLDRADVERAVLNLAINARDAMPGGGRFAVGAALRADRPGDSTLEISFADSGTGMDPDTVAHCLEPFFTTKPRGRGTGLGLATVHATVIQAGGELRIDSETGKGTCITMSLPAHHQAQRVAGTSHGRRRGRGGDGAGSPSATTGARPVVLFVDDEAELVRLGARALEDAGYSVITAHGGIDALALLGARRGAVDLLVTDAVMPGMSGAELGRAVARRFPQVPVLFTSGYLDADAPLRLRVPSGARVLEKPYTPGELAERVKTTLDAARRLRRYDERRPFTPQGSNL